VSSGLWRCDALLDTLPAFGVARSIPRLVPSCLALAADSFNLAAGGNQSVPAVTGTVEQPVDEIGAALADHLPGPIIERIICAATRKRARGCQATRS
jgi:hypothetical protein